MALYGRDANGNDAYIRGTGTGSLTDGYVTAHDPFTSDLKFVGTTVTASGDAVAGVVGSKLRVLSLALSADAPCTIKFQSDAVTDISGTFYLAADTTSSISNPIGLFETSSGDKLSFVQTGTANVGISIGYREVVA